MKITIETDYAKCEVKDDNIETMDYTLDLMIQALRGFGFADETIAEGLIDKAREMNSDKIILDI